MSIDTKVPDIGTKEDLSEMDNIVSYNIIKDRKKYYKEFSRKRLYMIIIGDIITSIDRIEILPYC
ncbi:MAG: hypothetical protein HFJ44_02305 [Clostridia bacterium]|nr:hypothetical protein [Clostridia bacterium]